jgi:sensor histidine kinase YesM
MENAIEHGIAEMQQGKIIIRIYKTPEDLILEVENTGKLSTEDMGRIDAILNGETAPMKLGATHVGIRNTNERLKMLYGLESGLSITMTPSGTTLSRIVIKLIQDSN